MNSGDQDALSGYYSDLLTGSYDCVDRIVLNAYFQMGHSPAGFRAWWRMLHNGSDDDLDTEHLMRMAGRFARRLRAHAQKNKIPIIECAVGERKHDHAEEHIPSDPMFRGLFLIQVSRSPAPLWEVTRGNNGYLDIARKKPFPFVNHYSFHIIDPDWGHITIKICGHPPFPAVIMLNGHEFVAAQTKKAGHPFTKEGNCFTQVTDAKVLAQVADTLRSQDAVGRLSQICSRWIYSACLRFALSSEEREASGFAYCFSLYQAEYSRNLLFRHGAQMDDIFDRLIDRNRRLLRIDRIKTILGLKRRPKCNRKKAPRWEVAVETPVYGLTVFKIHFGALTLKVYTKGECVLRFEIIVHNARKLGIGTVLGKFPAVMNYLQATMLRFTSAINSIDTAFISDPAWRQLSAPAKLGKTQIGGVDIHKPRIRVVMNAVIALAPQPKGFTAAQLASKVCSSNADFLNYTSKNAAYDLKKLRAKGLVQLPTKARRYDPTTEGLRAIAAIITLYDRVLQPILAGATQKTTATKPIIRMNRTLDEHYEAIKLQMSSLFADLGIAV